jgi:hypothetical protein
MRLVTINVWQGKAYLPVQAQIMSGPFMDIEPVYITELKTKSLSDAIEKVLSAGHPQLPDPTREEMKRRKDPILSATRTRSWKELAAGGACYTIVWDEAETSIQMSRLDSEGRWEYDPQKKCSLPPDTQLGKLVDIILQDIYSRSELTL